MMKRSVVMFIVLLTLTFAATCSAEYNFVRVSDYGASRFVERMVQSNIYKQLVNNGTLISFVSPVHRPNQHDQGFEGLAVYASAFGIKDASNPDGVVLFYTDPQGYIYAARVSCTGNPQVGYAVLVMTLEALEVTEQEGNVLLQTQGPKAEVWCSRMNRRILRLVMDNNGNDVAFFASSN